MGAGGLRFDGIWERSYTIRHHPRGGGSSRALIGDMYALFRTPFSSFPQRC